MTMTIVTRRRTAVVAGAGLLALVAWWWRPPAPPTPLERSHSRQSAEAPTLVAATEPILAPQPDLEPGTVEPTEPEPLDPQQVRCPVKMDDPVEGTVEMTVELESAPGTTRHAAFPVEIREGALVFEDAYAGSLHQGQITVPGYLRTAFAWTPAAAGGYDCGLVELKQGAVIVGTVRPLPREGVSGAISVRGCGGFTWVAPDGSFYLEGAPQPCELHASRVDGWYPVVSEPVRVVPRLGEEVEVAFVLPEAQQAGMGVRAEPVEEGMRIDGVRSGSAADEMGLRKGDLVVSVDGIDVAGMELSEFSALTQGNVGSELVIEVMVGEVREKRTLTRVFVPSEVMEVESASGVERHPDPDAWVR